jgi:methyltransferase
LSAVHLIVGLVALERLAELAYSRRNTARLMAAGAAAVGDGHYLLMVLLHAAWLASLWFAVPPDKAPNIPLLLLYGLLQGGRIWVLATLGPYWTTRIITLPGAPLITGGPYRYMRHPNYAIVAGEILVLPLAFHAWMIALFFSALNGALLYWRIRIESRALAPRRGVSRAL